MQSGRLFIVAMVFYFNHDKESTWILLDGFCGHGHSCVDLCSWLGWEDTFMVLCAGARPPLRSGNTHVAVDLVSLRSRGPGTAVLGPGSGRGLRRENAGLPEISRVEVVT